ncbi:asparagine synthase (glutamine-hydrolyzing) [Streptomyces bambusae]|uniref:asparagine synthase (glutamine-hydrolyzing) n=1 Tax=Streptomyces bambusae TaxID=1550616 RepID=UPI001CFFD84A|nr:asparagine synthase (glutamine-hydrolyzing) [Streptomyces bambusae]MCB5169891.1 asparagine synthase (glutamine-hydrolyzing) [Streptomyces bambusae]
MCGLVGFVSSRGPLPGDNPELDLKAMVETLAARGPDGEATWMHDGAALGHTRLSVVDLAGGRQPMVHEADGEPVAALVFTGEIYNHRELRAELAARGHRFRTSSDTEVVLAAYLAWGRHCAGRLEGMFAFAVWDVRTRTLLLGRDRFGVKPLYYRHDGDLVWFGSEPKAVLAHPHVPAVLDLDGLRELVLAAHPMISTPGRTPFHGLREVPPGHTAVFSPGRHSMEQYWSLSPREHLDDLPTTVSRIRELLEEAVRSHSQADVPVCTLLSGGLDSSAIAALGRGERQLRTVSVDFGASQSSDEDAMRRGWDAPYVALMREYLGSDHREVTITPAELAAPEHRRDVIGARDALGLGDFDASLMLLFRAAREQHTVALAGDGSDELFGGYRWSVAATKASFPWSDAVGRGDLTRLLDAGLSADLDLAVHRDELARAAAGELSHLPGADAQERRLRTASYLSLTRFLPVLLERADRLGMSCGLEIRVPFLDRRLAEYVFNVPWTMKTFDGREKSLLRAATRGRLPDAVLDRTKSPYPVVRDPAYRAALTGQVRNLLDAGGPALALLDRQAVRSLLVEAEGDSRFPREGLEFVLDLNLWLHRHEPSVRL